MSPDGYFHDSFNYEALVEALLQPLGPGGSGRFRRSVFDFRTDTPVAAETETAPAGAILLFDGVFLLRSELREYFDYSVFVQADFATTTQRAERRDVALFGDVEEVRRRYRERYVPGQQLYLSAAQPERWASIILDNNDPAAPQIRESRIQIVPYDPEWPVAFEAEAMRLRAALKTLALRIDHHGSTAIPGLGAKPIIDIQVSVAALQPLSAYGAPLEAIGYTHLPHPDDSFCPFFYRPSQWPHTHHVHVVERGGREERRTLAFRDYLRDHRDVARQYEDLKRVTAAQIVSIDAEAQDRYAAAKTEFVERVVGIALSRGYPRDLPDWLQ